MRYQLAGVALVIVGDVVSILGEKTIGANPGAIANTFSLPPSRTKLVKWAAAVLLFWFGVALVIEAGPL